MEWISVKDRLPEKEIDYLVYIAPPRGYHLIETAKFVIYPDGRTSWRIHDMLCQGEYYITHWMQLPEAPKGSSD